MVGYAIIIQILRSIYPANKSNKHICFIFETSLTVKLNTTTVPKMWKSHRVQVS